MERPEFTLAIEVLIFFDIFLIFFETFAADA